VNDTLGHLAGDELLRQIARRLQSVVRASDTVARLGGDEFGVILPAPIDRDDARNAAGRVLAELSEPFTLGEGSVNVGASIGISVYPDHGLDAETLIRRADEAMYDSKRNGTGYAETGNRRDERS
jgi:diguanylate cyclase